MKPGKDYIVMASALNVRKQPKIAADNKRARLPQGHRVTFVAEADDPKWWRIHTTLDGEEIDGFVVHEYLADAQAVGKVPAAELFSKQSVSRTNKRWPFALNEPGAPRRIPGSPDAADQFAAIIGWLDSENSGHVRYWPKPRPNRATYCNIYAYDYCYLSDAYLPRVWWNAQALRDLQNGKLVKADYGKTVLEQSANALYDWLTRWSAGFGWTLEPDLTKAQRAANAGKVVIMSGKNGGGAGHIVAIVPETDAHKAVRGPTGKVTIPLQSQAGARNRRYRTVDWGKSPSWRGRGVWIHG